MRISRDIAALVASILLFGLVPIYDTPFGGCVESGFLTFLMGCSAWPEFLRGFIFITTITIVASRKIHLTAFGLLIILLVVMVGGVALIGTGEEVNYFQANYLALTVHLSNPLLLGALAALLTCVAITKSFQV